MARFKPIPDPRGALDPPRRPPPTALACATPEPEPKRDEATERAYQAALVYCAMLLRCFQVLRLATPREWITHTVSRLSHRVAHAIQTAI